jgi:hypothetical protein
MVLLILAVYIVTSFAVVPAAIARSKGHGFILWWVVGTVLPVVAIPIALRLPSRPDVSPARPRRPEQAVDFVHTPLAAYATKPARLPARTAPAA